MRTRLNFPPRLPLPGIYIEPGPDTPPSLVQEIQRRRAATVLPIPFRPPSNQEDLREAAMAEEAVKRGWIRP